MSSSACLLQAVAFLDLVAVSLIIPLIPNYARQNGANHIQVGLLGSIYAGFQLGSGPIIGSLSDIRGRKSILLITLICSGITYSLLGFTSSVTVILFIRAFLGLFKQTQTLVRALVADLEKNSKNQSALYGKLAAISGAGMTIGPVLGGHIIEDNPEHGFKLVAFVVGICFILNAGLAYCLPDVKEPLKKRQGAHASKKSVVQSIVSSLKQSVIELYKIQWSKYWHIFLLKAFIGLAMGVYYSNYAVYLKQVYKLSPKYVGYVISFQGIMGVISSYCIEYVNRWYSHDKDFSQRTYHVFFLIMLSFFGLILSNNILVYIACLIPLAIGNSIARLVTLEMVLTKGHGDHRGLLIGASNSTRSLTGIVAPMIAGFIGEYIGVSYVIYASLLSMIMGTIMSYQIRTINERLKTE